MLALIGSRLCLCSFWFLVTPSCSCRDLECFTQVRATFLYWDMWCYSPWGAEEQLRQCRASGWCGMPETTDTSGCLI